MATTIQIKRGSGAPPTLAQGEPAWDLSGNDLWIGDDAGNRQILGYGATVEASEINAGTPGNSFSVDSGGHVALSGDATVWQDLNFSIKVRATGTGVPVADTMIGNIKVPKWQLNDVEDCEGEELPHQAKLDTSGQWHCHVVTNGVDTSERRLRFEVEWASASVNGQIVGPTTTQSDDYIIPSGTPSGTHGLLHIGWVSLSGLGLGSHVWPRLKRIASISGTAPTGDPFCDRLQMHLELDSIGSRTASGKFS